MRKMMKFLLAWAFFLGRFPGLASAQVVYTDLNAFTTHSSEYWDIDGNGSADLGVVWSYEDWDDSTTASAAIPFGGNDANGFAASGALALKMAAGETINSALTFKNDTTMLSEYWDDWDAAYVKWGNWDNMDQGDAAYLGFRFMDGDDAFYYGWIRARVNPDNIYITLYDMAWETEVGKAIIAGDMGSPVPVPGTVWLMGTGLLGLAGVRRQP